MFVRFRIQGDPGNEANTFRDGTELVKCGSSSTRVSDIVGTYDAILHWLKEFGKVLASGIFWLLCFRGNEEKCALAVQSTLDIRSLYYPSVC